MQVYRKKHRYGTIIEMQKRLGDECLAIESVLKKPFEHIVHRILFAVHIADLNRAWIFYIVENNIQKRKQKRTRDDIDNWQFVHAQRTHDQGYDYKRNIPHREIYASASPPVFYIRIRLKQRI
jgi:hypothetical protein